MGGIFSSPKAPEVPDTSDEEQRRADMLDAQEKRERRSIASRRSARRGIGGRLMTQTRTPPELSNNDMANTLGGIRNPRIG